MTKHARKEDVCVALEDLEWSAGLCANTPSPAGAAPGCTERGGPAADRRGELEASGGEQRSQHPQAPFSCLQRRRTLRAFVKPAWETGLNWAEAVGSGRKVCYWKGMYLNRCLTCGDLIANWTAIVSWIFTWFENLCSFYGTEWSLHTNCKTCLPSLGKQLL